MAGSDYTSGSNSGWETFATAKHAVGHNANAVVTTTNATWQITGVQLEVGEQATPFEHRSFGEELLLCQRYYYQSAEDITGQLDGGSWHGHSINTTECFGSGNCFSGYMRATPTIVILDASGATTGASLLGTGNVTGIAASLITNSGFIKISKSSGLTADREYQCHFTADAEL